MATAAQYQAAYLRIFRNNTLSDAEAAALAAQDTGPGFETAAFQNWARQFTTDPSAVLSTGGILKIWDHITGAVPNAVPIPNDDLTGQVNTIEAQIQGFTDRGFPPNEAKAYAYKGMGASLANSSFSGDFAAVWNQNTDTALGQQSFVQAAFEAVFGRPPNAAELAANLTAFLTVKAFYEATPVPETAIDARAKGEFIADLVLQMIDFSLTSEPDPQNFTQLGNAIIALASDTYIGGIPIEDQPLPPGTGQTFDLTIGVDGPPEYTATAAGAVYNALPEGNPPLGTTNTLNVGDNLQDPFNDGILNYTGSFSFINPAFANGVTLNGIATANITSLGVLTGFAGNITGLHTATVTAGSTGNVQLGTAAVGLNTALQTVNLNASVDFTAWTAANALVAIDDEILINLNGVSGPQTVTLNTVGGSPLPGYEVANVDSGGPVENFIFLNTNTTTIATVNVVGAQDLTIRGNALDTDNLELFDSTAAGGDVDARFIGGGTVTVNGGVGNDLFAFADTVGNVTVDGGPGNDRFVFESTGAATFGTGDTANGGTGTDVLEIQVSGAGEEVLLVAGVGPNITNIETIRHTGTLSGAFPNGLYVDMSRAGSATNLELAGSYAGDVEITNMSSNQEVFLQSNITEDLRIFPTVGPLPIVNLDIGNTAAGGVVLGTSSTTFGLETTAALVNINSSGNTTTSINQMSAADFIDASVVITGSASFGIGARATGTFDAVVGARTTEQGGNDTFAAGEDTSNDTGYEFADGFLDASGATGRVILVAGDDNQTISGGSAADFIRGGDNADGFFSGAGHDVMTGNAGADVFYFFDTAETRSFWFFGDIGDDSTAANIDHITDFNAAEDFIGLNEVGLVGTVDFTGTAVANVTAVNIGAAADIDALFAAVNTAVGGAAASTSTTASIYDVTVATGGLAGHYVMVNNSTGTLNTNDTIINITGSTGTVTDGNFQFWA